MDPRLLKYYESELAFMREMGAEFASTYPKIASRLGIEGMEVLDPYVERLMEGFAFLAGRVQLQLDLKFPAFTQHLLEIVYPHYLAPTPSMTVVRFDPDAAQGGIADGFSLPRGTVLRSDNGDSEIAPIEFRTAHDVMLLPLAIDEAEYLAGRGAVAALGFDDDKGAKAAIRLRLRRTDDKPIEELNLDSLQVFLNGAGPEPWRLYEQIIARGVGLVARSADRRRDWKAAGEPDSIRQVGFGADEALLPYPGASFNGYRLLQEYYAMPARYFFVELGGLRRAMSQATDAEADIYILLSEVSAELRDMLDPSQFQLFCTPAVNLFPKLCDRIHVTGREQEHHVVADRTQPMNFEIHTVTSVDGMRSEGEEEIAFSPFYSADDFTAAGESQAAYFTVSRQMRRRSEKQRLRGARTSYMGSEVYLSLVDRTQAPFPDDVEQLAVQSLCTNRDLALLFAPGSGDTDFSLPGGGPVRSVRALVGPTRPQPSLAQGDAAWRLISHLSLNYLSLIDQDKGEGASALRELLAIYAPLADVATNKQLEGVVSVSSRPIVRRLADEVLSTAVRGQEITLTFDESYFEGAGPFVLGAVLDRFFAKYVSLNSFTETVIRSSDRGEMMRWPARSGARRLI